MKTTFKFLPLLGISLFAQCKEADFQIVDNSGNVAQICVDTADWKGVTRAVQDLALDIQRVSDRKAEVINSVVPNGSQIIAGTIGKSQFIDSLVSAGRLNVDGIRGEWESYVIETIDGNLVIAGSDKRGTIYGIYEVSETIGVSPWYWYADAPIQHQNTITWQSGRKLQPSPKVKYRGIFINDEWPSFGTWCNNHFGGVNSQMYSNMFELILRLRGNYLWPAMWASRFNEDDTLSPKIADEYGIVMGTSHHEPMMRAHKEYTTRRDSIGPWNYATNKPNLDKFFEDGLRRNCQYDNLITIGMRGDGDVAMGNGDDEENMRTLTSVVEGQRQIIERVYQKPASEIPQLWAIFTEVQRYYDAGFTVPDDVTLLFCDNNWGYIRRAGTPEARQRKGGMGMYYHIDMNGGPWNDRWVNTTTPHKIREQLNIAYQTGIDRIWIINVGDLKPKEMPIDFIMDYAWDPDAIPADKVDDWTTNWAKSIFGPAHAKEIADIITEYSKLNLERKPEVQRVGIYSASTGEAQRMADRWDSLESRTLALSKDIPDNARDAWYQLVEYPAVASAGVAKIYLYATINHYLAQKNNPLASKYADMARQLFERDSVMTEKYNKEISNGKWDGYMLDKHIGYSQWFMPDRNILPELQEVSVSDTESDASFTAEKYWDDIETSEIDIMAHDYSRISQTETAKWTFLPGLGRGKGNMGIEPVTSPSFPDGNGPALEYDIEFQASGSQKLAVGILPTNDIYPARGLRLGVRIDNGELQVIDARQGYVDTFSEYTPENIARSKVLKPLPAKDNNLHLTKWQPMRSEIFDNIRWLSVNIDIPTAGLHTVKIVMIDPEIVVEKLILNPDNDHPTYYGIR